MEKKKNWMTTQEKWDIVQEKWDLEHHLFHIGETLVETNDMMNNRLSEIHKELKSIEQALWRMTEEIHKLAIKG